jgi:hypothetical protein
MSLIKECGFYLTQIQTKIQQLSIGELHSITHEIYDKQAKLCKIYKFYEKTEQIREPWFSQLCSDIKSLMYVNSIIESEIIKRHLNGVDGRREGD